MIPWAVSGPRVRVLLFSLVLLALPFAVVEITPCVDLPQHVAQARLFVEHAGDGESPYVIQWLTPYWLAYAPLILLYFVLPPLLAGKIGLWLLAAALTTAIHVVASRRDRPPEAAVLASVFVFGSSLYWGFISFLAGMAVFLGWTLVCCGPPRGWRRDLAIFFLWSWLLYFAHALWLLAALAWLGARTLLLERRRLAEGVVRFAAAAPALLVLLLRSRSLSSPQFDLAARWFDWPMGRLVRVEDAVLGGLRGPVETVLVLLALAWVLAGLVAARRAVSPRPRLDTELALGGAFFLAAYLLLPDRYLNTLLFAQRWAPMAAILLVLAVPPPPRVSVFLRRAAIAAAVAGFVVVTALSWRAYDSEELAGLHEALQELPEAPSVLGLDLRKESAFFDARPGLQQFAWAQALRGGTLNFSFAEHPASLVIHRPGWKPSWTPGLEWHPERLQPTDFSYFDFVLVNADPKFHALLGELGAVAPVTDTLPWRLYRVVKGTPRGPRQGTDRPPP